MKKLAIAVVASLLTMCLLLVLADLYDITRYIPLSKNYDWLGFMGAIVGGGSTLAALVLTIEHERKLNKENSRLSNIPILKIEIESKSLEEFSDAIFTLYGSEVLTSAFPHNSQKRYPVLKLSLANNSPAFNVCLDLCATREVPNVNQSSAYFPCKYRLVEHENTRSMFMIAESDKYPQPDILGILRISYSDIFDNQYYQDVSFSYRETDDSSGVDFEIIGAMTPVLVGKSSPTLENRLLEAYGLYE